MRYLVVLLFSYVVVCLALALFVAWVFADDHDATVATDDLALVANLLDAWVNLHVFYFFSYDDLFVAVDNAATSQVVGAQLNNHAVLWEDLDVVLTHLA